MRSAMPQLSRNVPCSVAWKNIAQNVVISRKPTRRSAAFVLPPLPPKQPSTKPAPSATTFFKAPHASAPATSLILVTRKVGGSLNNCRVMSLNFSFRKSQASVDSHMRCLATSFAIFAPMSTPHLKPPPIAFSIDLDINAGSFVSVWKSKPLIKLTPLDEPCAFSRMMGSNFGRNWCGNTKINNVAFLHASFKSGIASTLGGNLIPGRYLMFSW
mmetsp:Transcript_37645/g.80371  ORF Transcript_37645/g.80371 Transcript_37645/m.80371 type:complete len:214 (-) Transcript_37645:442-1083(-)